MTSSVPWDEHVLMLAGVPRELGAVLDEREHSELKVSACDKPGTSRIDGGEMERPGRWGDVRLRW